jgi:hypothetical protein
MYKCIIYINYLGEIIKLYITFKSLQRKIYDTMQIENEIAKKNNRMETFLKKWEKCQTALKTLFFLTPIFVHTSSPFVLFSFFNPKNHLHKRNSPYP